MIRASRSFPLFLLLLISAAGCSRAASTDVSQEMDARPIGPVLPTIAASHAEGAVTLLDTTHRAVAAVVTTGKPLGSIAITPDGQEIFAATAAGISVIDVREARVLRVLAWPDTKPTLAVSGNRLYVVENTDSEESRITAVDRHTGAVLLTRAIQTVAGTPIVAPDGSRVFVPHNFYSGRVTVLDAPKLSVRKVLTFEDGAARLRLSSEGRRLFVPNGNTFGGRVNVVDAVTLEPIGEVALEGEPMDIAFSPDGKTGYVTSFREHALVVVDTTTLRVVKTMAVPDYPTRVSVSQDGSAIYVMHNAPLSLTVIDRETLALSSLPLRFEPTALIAP